MEYKEPKCQAFILQVATDTYLFDGKKKIKYVLQNNKQLTKGTIIRVYKWHVGSQPDEMVIEAYQNLGSSYSEINRSPPWSTSKFEYDKPLNIAQDSYVPAWLKDPKSIYNMTFEEVKQRNKID